MAISPFPAPAESSGVPLEPLLTPYQVAEYLQIDVSTVRRLFLDRYDVVKIGRTENRKKRSYVTLRIPLSTLRRFMEERR